MRTTKEVLAALRQQVNEHKIDDASQLRQELKRQIMKILTAPPAASENPLAAPPRVLFVVGVNGTGKTTTIGKLANRLKKEGRSVMLCAADTFRAAAIEQLEVWARRSGVELIKQKSGSDPSAVIFDALSAAQARSADLVIVDTAGRLHTKSNLMAELEKMKRTASKIVPGAPHDVLLVLDATTGQNGLNQAREFWSHAGVTGIVLTKLDGTAKGGIVVAIARELNLPIRLSAPASRSTTSCLLTRKPMSTRSSISANEDAARMERALELARRGVCARASESEVGAVVVKNGRVVGEGFHVYDRLDHAEIVALKQAGEKSSRRNTLRHPRTLLHQGRTGPCTKAISPPA